MRNKSAVAISASLVLALAFSFQSKVSFRVNDSKAARESAQKAIGVVSQRLRDLQSKRSPSPQSPAITEGDFPALTETVLNQAAREEDRSAALYLLTQAKPLPVRSLGEIMRAPLPSSADSMRRSIEVAFRVRALEALDQRSMEDPGAARELEKEVAAEDVPSLRLLAQISLVGIQQGRPGKAGRFIDLALRGGDGR